MPLPRQANAFALRPANLSIRATLNRMLTGDPGISYAWGDITDKTSLVPNDITLDPRNDAVIIRGEVLHTPAEVEAALRRVLK